MKESQEEAEHPFPRLKRGKTAAIEPPSGLRGAWFKEPMGVEGPEMCPPGEGARRRLGHWPALRGHPWEHTAKSRDEGHAFGLKRSRRELGGDAGDPSPRIRGRHPPPGALSLPTRTTGPAGRRG